jgi:hypothetical protein
VPGEAFNRDEVSSIYVKPNDRFIVSLIVGIDQAKSMEEALNVVVNTMSEAPVRWAVFDRETGESVMFEVKP